MTTAMKLVGLASVRMMFLTVLWAFFLAQHIYFSPFEVRSSNNVETLSLFLLLVVAVTNLIKSFLADSGLVLSGPTVPFVQSLEFGENTMIFILAIYIGITELRLQRSNRKKC